MSTLNPTEQIKERLAIEQLVGETVTLKRSGTNYMGLCPFHNEKTPSFVVSPGRGMYHCFGCGVNGDIFGFVMATQHVEFGEALRVLAQRTGVVLEDSAATKGRRIQQSRLFDLTAAAALFYQGVLAGPAGAAARAYLDRRGLTKETRERFGIGFAPDAWEALYGRLRANGFGDEDIEAAGLAVRHEERGTLYDRFRGRVMFPIRDGQGRVLGFGGRVLDGGEPKYLNSPRTTIFDKGRVLFGLDLARDAIHKAGHAVLVEGYVDAIRAHQAGFATVVAALGTSITVDQLGLVARLAPRITLALDADPAGQKAAVRAGLLALSSLRDRPTGAVDLRVAMLPDGLDPDELIGQSPPRWQEAITAAVPIVDHFFALVLADLDPGAPDYKQRLIDALLPVIKELPGVGTQQTYLERLSETTGVDVTLLRKALLATGRGGLQTAGGSNSPAQQREQRPAQRLQVAALQRAAAVGDPIIGLEESLLAVLMPCVPLPEGVVDELADVGLVGATHRVLLGLLLAISADDDSAAPRARSGVAAAELLDMLGDEPDPDLAAAVERVAGLVVKQPRVPRERLAPTLNVYLARLYDLRARAELKSQAEMLKGLEVQPGDAPLQRAVESLATRHNADMHMLEQHAEYRLHS